MTHQVDPLQGFEDEVAPLWKWAIRVIGIFATVLGALFAWVQLREIPVPAIDSAEPTYIRRILLAIYYACWVAGTTLDVNIQKDVYRRDPLHGNVPQQATLAVVGLFAVAVFLLWASSSDERISLALIPFLVVNIIAWRILVQRVSPIIAATSSAYLQANELYRFEQLNIVKGYLLGKWQWARFSLMGLIVLATNVLCFSTSARIYTSGALHELLPNNSAQAIANVLPVAGLALFVAAAEMWIWIRRGRNIVALNTIAGLARKYHLRPREA